MENSGLSASDVLALTKNNDGMFGGDSWAWLIIIFLLAGGGFGFNGNRGDYITSPQFESANQFQALDRQLSGITYGIADSTFALNNAITGEGRGIQTALCHGFNDIKSTVLTESAATRNLIQENKIEALRDKVHALELQSALCGVVRYPTAMTYTSGPSPFCNPCGCQGNI